MSSDTATVLLVLTLAPKIYRERTLWKAGQEVFTTSEVLPRSQTTNSEVKCVESEQLPHACVWLDVLHSLTARATNTCVHDCAVETKRM